MARRIRLTWSQSYYKVNTVDGIRIRIEAVDAEEMPDKIFAYLLHPTNPATLAQAAGFDHVCSPVDLEEYPEDQPIANVRPTWFRLNYVDVLLRSQAELDQYLADIIADVKALKKTLDIMDTVTPLGEVWIDDEPEVAASSSEGSSIGG